MLALLLSCPLRPRVRDAAVSRFERWPVDHSFAHTRDSPHFSMTLPFSPFPAFNLDPAPSYPASTPTSSLHQLQRPRPVCVLAEDARAQDCSRVLRASHEIVGRPWMLSEIPATAALIPRSTTPPGPARLTRTEEPDPELQQQQQMIFRAQRAKTAMRRTATTAPAVPHSARNPTQKLSKPRTMSSR